MGNIIPTLNEVGVVVWERLSTGDDETAVTEEMERRIGRRGMKRRVRCDGEEGESKSMLIGDGMVVITAEV
jgi:hypothetical protein